MYQGATIELDAVIVFPQPRRTFEEIPTLALDIARKRMLNPPTVARFSPKNFAHYIEVINKLWNTDFSPDDERFLAKARVMEEEKVFHVLLAGERRFRSCCFIWAEGCPDCLDAFGKERPGVCFRRHFGGEKIQVRLSLNIPPIQALYLQLSENTHMAVPPHEEAHAYAQLFHLVKEADPEISVSRFARDVGRGPEKIKGALRYCLLPRVIQEAVEAKKIPYGIALEIARLFEAGIHDELELEWWAIRAITERKSVSSFREIISDFLFFRSSGQKSLDFAGLAEDDAMRQRHVREVVGRNLVGAVWTWEAYLKTAIQLCKEGKIGPGMPFSERSPARILEALTRQLETLLPLLSPYLSRKKASELERAIEATLSIAKTIE